VVLPDARVRRPLGRAALGFASPLAGFVAGGLFGFLNFVVSVPLTFVPHQVIVYQQAPPFPLTLRAGDPAQCSSSTCSASPCSSARSRRS
jgi:hypothetical protein